MCILRELWKQDIEEPDVKNSYQYVFELRKKLEDTLKLAHSELHKTQQRGIEALLSLQDKSKETSAW